MMWAIFGLGLTPDPVAAAPPGDDDDPADGGDNNLKGALGSTFLTLKYPFVSPVFSDIVTSL